MSLPAESRDLFAKYDVVVVGGGPVGLMTALECAKAEKKVLVLEQSMFFNQSGSSGDMVRMYRTAYTEDFMATLAVQSMSIWNELEQEAGKDLRWMSGLLNFGDPDYGAGGPEGTLTGPIANLDKHGMKYTKLDRDGVEKTLPFQNLPENWTGLDMPDNGTINVPLLLRTLHRLCRERQVDLFEYATVQKIRPDNTKIFPNAKWSVEGVMHGPKGASAQGNVFGFRADKIALTLGAYTNHVLFPSFGFTLKLNIWEMTSAYYAIDASIKFDKMWFQFQEDTEIGDAKFSNLFYGFPAVPWGPSNMCRIAVDSATNVITDPAKRSHAVISPQDLEWTRDWIRDHVVGVGPDPLPVFAGTCLQTNVADNMFVLDFIPKRYLPDDAADSIVVFTAGWAMKFVPLLGRVLKELLVDGAAPKFDISHFKFDRIYEEEPIICDGPVAEDVGPIRAVGSSMRMGH